MSPDRQADFRGLSADARIVGGSLFRMMVPGKGQLRFLMIESRPTARTKAALDELVAKGFASVEPFNRFGGITYRPLVEFPPAPQSLIKRAGSWQITEPIGTPTPTGP